MRIREIARPTYSASGVSVRLIAALAGALLPLCAAPATGQILAPKRGFADTGGSYSYLRATNANWYHTWGGGLGNPGGFDALHIPMFRSWTNIQDHVNWAISRPEPTEWVMCFNEPERSDQDNISVTDAMSRCWQIASGLAGTGIKIAGPAVSDNSGGWNWLADFMNRANSQGLPIDAVCFHWYGISTPDDPVGAANTFLGRVDAYHNAYGLPVFISEFAIHDWGGNYSDEAIRAANAIFLQHVIPGLESRSYVVGYAWYHWFGDARLVEGNPLLPTNVGLEYVGVLESGDYYDFSSDNLGEHVAYLDGGELAHDAPGGVLRYINALSGVSLLSGNADWNLYPGNWVRIQPGATLRKTGASNLTWTDTTITNEGTLEVTDGSILIDSGALIGGAGDVRVAAGGELSFTGARQVNLDFDVALGGGVLSTDIVTGFVVRGGNTFAGHGTVLGRLIAQADTVVRIGEPGLPPQATQFVIDDFNSYAAGLVRDVASPPWTAHGDGSGTMFARIEDDGSGSNNVLSYGWSDEFRGASRPIPNAGVINEGDVATFFFRFNATTDDPDHNFGLGDRATTGDVYFSDYEAQLRLFSDSNPTAGTYGLDARDGGAFVDLADSLSTNTWYNVWMVIDQGSDTFDVYLNTGVADATPADKLNAAPLAFRSGTSAALHSILALAGPAPTSYGVQIDDPAFLAGVDLTNPGGGLNPQIYFTPATLTIADTCVLNPGATLEIGIATPTAVDQVVTSGQFTADGTLAVVRDPATPTLQSGNVFDIIDASSITGTFDTIDLDPLGPGFLWDLRELYTAGVLSVLAGGDALDASAQCLSGPDNPAVGGCEQQDHDADTDVDILDFARWQECATTPTGVLQSSCLIN
jgi:hypothetical protein